MNTPKVLFYDIETSPIKVWTFNIGSKISIPHTAIVKGSRCDIICAAWKWAHEKEIHSEHWGFDTQNSSKIVSKLTKAIEEADIVIGHNADRFDWRHLNTQRLMNKLPAVDWSKMSEDTLKQIRKHFYLPSYKLDYIAQLLGVGGKSDMKFSDWIDIVERTDASKLDKMIKYCKKDVVLLQQVYNKVKPYMKPKYVFNATSSCNLCGSKNLIKFGTSMYKGKLHQKYFCKDHYGYAGRSMIKV